MKARIEAGTDIARLGAWHAARQTPALTDRLGATWDRAMAEDSAQAALFVIETGADGSGPVDV